MTGFRKIFTGPGTLARQSFWVMLVKALGMLLGYVVAILVSRRFGPVGLGLYSIAQTTMIVYGHVAGVGLPTAILRYAGQFSGPEDAGRQKTLYYKSLRVIGLSVVPLSVALILGAEFLANRVFDDPAHADTLRLVGLMAPFFTVNLINVEYLRGLGQAAVSEVYRTLVIPLLTAAGILAFHEFESMKLPIYALAGGVFLTALVSLVQTLRRVSAMAGGPTEFRTRELLGTAMPLMVVALGSYFLANVSLYMVQAIQDTFNTGVFALCLKLSLLISFVLLAVNTTIAPTISRLHWKGKQEELGRFIRKSTRYIFLLSALPFLLLILFPEALLSMINPDFSGGAAVLVILCFGQLLNAGCGPVGLLLNMSGHQKSVMQVTLVAVAFAVIANLALIYYHGILGAAIATMAAIGLKNIALVVLARKKLGIYAVYIPWK